LHIPHRDLPQCKQQGAYTSSTQGGPCCSIRVGKDGNYFVATQHHVHTMEMGVINSTAADYCGGVYVLQMYI
jgi:hypothetical protein